MGKQFTSIQLDKARNLRYGMRALDRIEDKLEKPLSEVSMNKLTTKQLAVFIWAGLAHEDPELTPEKVMDLVDEYSDIKTVSEILGKAIQESFGKNV
jgi:hypothetical protein